MISDTHTHTHGVVHTAHTFHTQHLHAHTKHVTYNHACIPHLTVNTLHTHSHNNPCGLYRRQLHIRAHTCTETRCSIQKKKRKNKNHTAESHRFQQILQRWWRDEGGGGGGGRIIDPRSSLSLLLRCCCHHHLPLGKKTQLLLLHVSSLLLDQNMVNSIPSSFSLSFLVYSSARLTAAAGPALLLLLSPSSFSSCCRVNIFLIIIPLRPTDERSPAAALLIPPSLSLGALVKLFLSAILLWNEEGGGVESRQAA